MINKSLIKNAWLHFCKICNHKFWVAYYCFKAGLYWQGITHDLSKFSPVEFWESVKFYQGTSSPIPVAKKVQGYSKAWQHHKGHNPHHYEYWTDNYDSGTTTIPMPYKYAVELVCDYLAAARAYQDRGKFSYIGEMQWWQNRLNTINPKIHPKTAQFVTSVFSALAWQERKRIVNNPIVIFNQKFLKEQYRLSNIL